MAKLGIYVAKISRLSYLSRIERNIRSNLVHSNLMFMIGVWLMYKSNHFVTTFVRVLHVTIVVDVRNHTCNDIMTNPNFSCTRNYNL
jgi:hypothetical protein